MKIPPFFIVFRTYSGEKKTFGFWFPVFLVWLIFFVVFLALSPIILIIALLTWDEGRGKKLLLFGPLFFSVLAGLHGLAVQTGDRQKSFFITFV